MQKTLTLLFLFSVLFSFNSFGQLLLEENFDYGAGDNGDITALTSNWLRHSGTQGPAYSAAGLSFNGYNDSDIVGNLTFTNGSSGVNDGDVNHAFADSISTDSTIFVSFLVELDTAKTGDYFLHLGPKTIGTTFRLRIFAKDSSGADGWLIGLSKSSSGIVYDTIVLAYHKTYLVIAKYTLSTVAADDDEVSLYVYEDNVPQGMGNPLTLLGPLGAGVSGDPTDIGSIAIRQGTNTPTGKIDGIRIATSWAELFNIMTIARAIEDLNNDYIPDRLNDTVTVVGVIFSPNFQTTNNSFYIYDGTAGTDIFMYGPPVLTWALGDMVKVTGVVTHYNGMTEVVVADTTGWVLLSSGNPTPAPIVITLGQYKANPELYEGSLVAFVSLTKVSGTWPASGNANLSFSDGIDTVVFRIDSDTDIDGQPEPTWPRDIIGIGSQFDSSPPYDGGYQIFPRSFATDILPENTVPVELVSLTANFVDGAVLLSWKTATETNNLGFAVEKSLDGQSFTDIGFVNGSGTTTEAKSYSFVDSDLGTATNLFYRLRQIDYNGQAVYTTVIQVEVVKSISFNLAQNYPNPFNPATTIGYVLQEKSHAKLTVLNALGEEIAVLLNQDQDKGYYTIQFDGSNLSSGVYFYKLVANDFVSTRKMLLIK